MKKLFFLLLPMLAAAWLAGLGGCRKCKIEGRVLEFGTEKPIPNATAILSECEGEVFGSFTCFETARTVVGSDGAFAFKETGISLSAEAANYWPTGDDFKLVFDECPEPTTLYLYPHAWLEVTIRNQSGAYKFSHGNDVSLYLLKGMDTTITEFNRGNVDNKFIFGVRKTANDSLPTSQGDLNSIEILDVNGNISHPSLEGSLSPWFKTYLPGHQITQVTVTY